MARRQRMGIGQLEIGHAGRWLRLLEWALAIDCRRARALVDPRAPGNPRALASVRRALVRRARAERALAERALVKQALLALVKRAPGETRTAPVRWFASGR